MCFSEYCRDLRQKNNISAAKQRLKRTTHNLGDPRHLLAEQLNLGSRIFDSVDIFICAFCILFLFVNDIFEAL